MIKKEILEKVSAVKARKPKFLRQDIHKKKRLAKKWKKPKGLQSKLKYSKGNCPHGRRVEVGFGLAKEFHGIVNGLRLKIVYNKKDLEKVNASEEGALFAGSIGTKKKLELLKEAVKKNIRVFNVKDAQAYIKDIEEAMTKKKADKKKASEKKKAKEKKPKAKKEEPKKEEKTEEEKKKEEKKEKDKVLIKKN